MLYESLCPAVPERMSRDALGTFYTVILRAKAALEYLETGIGEQIKGRLIKGEAIPGCMLEEGLGREEWSAPDSDIISMADLMGINLKKEEVVTPAQAKKMGLPADIVAAFSQRPKRGFKVVIDNNKKARSIFNHE